MSEKNDPSNGHPPKREGNIKPKTKPSARKRATKRIGWTFPQNTLEEAIRLAQVIEEKNAGKPIKAAASACSYLRSERTEMG